jgi:hypothetical protein
MSDVNTKEFVPQQQLTDVGTRYEHYSQLIDQWEVAANQIKKIQPQYRSDREELMMSTLEDCATLLRRQMEAMAKYDTKQWSLRDEINRIPKDPSKIQEVKNG